MPSVTIELTENEAHIIASTLDSVADFIFSSGPEEVVLDEFNLTKEETDNLRSKIQTCEDNFQRRSGDFQPDREPIPWPPTDLNIIEYLSDVIKEQLQGNPPCQTPTSSSTTASSAVPSSHQTQLGATARRTAN